MISLVSCLFTDIPDIFDSLSTISMNVGRSFGVAEKHWVISSAIPSMGILSFLIVGLKFFSMIATLINSTLNCLISFPFLSQASIVYSG